MYNFYSSGDEVFAEASHVPGLVTGMFHWPTFSLSWPFVDIDFTPDAFPWQKQEVFKGINVAGSLSAGWGFHCWTTNINNEAILLFQVPQGKWQLGKCNKVVIKKISSFTILYFALIHGDEKALLLRMKWGNS